MSELLTDPKEKRYRLFPLKYPDIWNGLYNSHKSMFWSAEEIQLGPDLHDWREKLNEDERNYLKFVLAFFAVSDFIVNEACQVDQEETTVLEYKFYLDYKVMIENVHSHTYGLLLDTYVADSDEKNRLFDAVNSIAVIKKKVEWFQKYIQDGSYSERMIATAIVEGIFFCSSFASIFYMRSRGLLPGLCVANDLIARDESFHRDAALYIYKNYIKNKVPKTQVLEMIKNAVEIEKEFASESLSVDLIGMNATEMCQYIEYVADDLVYNLYQEKLYNVTCPFQWILSMGQYAKADFFNVRSTAYGNQAIISNVNQNKEQNEITFDSEF